MQKVVLKLDVRDDLCCKKKAIKLVSSVPGLDSISMDMKEKKLTVTGDMDPVALVKRLRKNFCTEILSVGPAKEAPKKPEEPKVVVQVSDVIHAMQAQNSYYSYPCYSGYTSYARSVEEDPISCVIC